MRRNLIFGVVLVFLLVLSAGAVAAIPADNSQAEQNNQAPDTPATDKEVSGQDSHPLEDPEHPGNENQNATENVPDHANANLPFTIDIFEPEGEEIPVNEFGNISETQYDALEELNLEDPFKLTVYNPGLAGEESHDYAVTTF
ncbi:hypothetical protein AMET1_0543 [Methanonatronarchaeum thermophilum]|uniref:Uncharacterized protein n=1 Tax=Methanonatronarchaeum thermophilum TaxID=1927129 RepID=A0A1Y3GBQ9_9EURY|nr:hypothetical protein [Methanonatronarchaeum thermophilum]OUJ18892.1 hypothetical protein AMET1_0543 [Methanonatronarchaeum thermophilum]